MKTIMRTFRFPIDIENKLNQLKKTQKKTKTEIIVELIKSINITKEKTTKLRKVEM